MCYICQCFGWALDFAQRVLTFVLACIMCCAICIGISVAIAAGIAYGYNYMIAEFLTLARSDLSVYVRRGQFYDKPNYGKGLRRKGDEDDLFSSNSSDYQDAKVHSVIDTKPLSDTWLKALDTRKYAEKLTKYSHEQLGANNVFNRSGHVPKPAVAADVTTENLSIIRRVYSVSPNPGMPTTIHPARTDIVMRNFGPVDKMPMSPNSIDEDFYEDRSTLEPKKKHHKDKNPDIKINLKDKKRKSYIPLKDLSKSKPHADYPTEDVDEDNIAAYKPV